MRKRFLWLFTALLGVGGIVAQNPVILPNNSRFDIIPANDNNSSVAFAFYNYDGGYNRDYNFTIYDEDFNLVNELNIPVTTLPYSSYRWEAEVVGIKKAKIDKSYPMEVFNSFTPEQVCEYIEENLDEETTPKIFTLDDGTVLVGFGGFTGSPIRPQTFYFLDNGVWYMTYYVELDLNDVVVDYLPENKTEYEYEYSLTPADINVCATTGGDEYYLISRGIFSNDFNYILPEVKSVTLKETISEYNREKTGGTRYVTTGFKIYDVKGMEVLSISIPDGYYSSSRLYTVTTSGKSYLLIGVGNLSDYIETAQTNDSSFVIYRLDNKNHATQIAITPANAIFSSHSKERRDGECRYR